MEQRGVSELVVVDCTVYSCCRSSHSEAYCASPHTKVTHHLLNGSLLFLQFLVVLNGHR